MALKFESLSDYGIAEAAELLARGFANYPVKIDFTPGLLLHMAAQDGVQMADSRVAIRGEKGLAVALVARRGWSSRLAGMGVVPEAQATGVGTWMMTELVEESKQRGERRMELEVIETNTAGVRLYEKSGFGVLRRLISFELSDSEEGSRTQLAEVDIREVARQISASGLRDLPWQVSGETIAQLGPPNAAYKAGSAYAVVTDTSESAVAIRTVIVEPQARGQGQAANLLRGLMAEFPGKQWRVPALCPEEIGGIFKSVGFAEGSLAQFHMVREWG